MNEMRPLEDYADRMRPKTAANLLLWAIGAFVLIFILWAAFTELDRTVRGMGRIIPSSQLQVVSNLEGGIVEEILVRTGDMVRQGAPLVRLDQTQTGADFGSNRAQFDALRMRIARLEAELAGRTPVFPVDNAGAGEQAQIERSLHASRMADLSSLLSAAQSRVTQAGRHDDAKVIVLDAEADAETPAPAPSKPAPAKPAPTKPAAQPAAVDVGFAVQLAAFSSQADANKLRDRARSLGFRAFTETVATDKGDLVRVRLGPVSTRAEAEALQAQARAKLAMAGVVRPHP